MCHYSNTHFKLCGCTVSEQTERCGYHDDCFSECMKYTEIKELEPREGRCGRRICKYQASKDIKPEWRVKDSVGTVEPMGAQRQAKVA